MGNNVYVVGSESVYDYDVSTRLEVFSIYKKAKAYFDKLVKEGKANNHLMNCKDVVINESDDYFEIYKDGYYQEDHYFVWIMEKEVY